MSHTATTTAKCITLEQAVIRCGCTDAEKLAPAWHAKRGDPCPKPRQVEQLGVVAYWHRNPLRLWAWRLNRWAHFKRAGRVHRRHFNPTGA
jgi:hypothetical protein